MYLKVDGAEIYYEVHGEGEPVFFLNGLLGNPQMWKKYQLSNFESEYKCVFHCFRGQEFSRVSKPFLIEDLVDDLDQLIEAIGFNQVNLCGDAFGAGIILRYLIKHPHKVNKAIIGVFPTFPDKVAFLTIKSWFEVLQKTDLETMFHVMLPDLFGKDFLIEIQNELDDIMGMFIGEKNKSDYLQLFESLFNRKSAIEYGDIETPVLIVQGENDRFITKQHGLNAKQIIPKSKYIEMKAGHVPLMEQPDVYADIVKRFLQG